ncbi:hypothetical protein AB0E63_41895 [Kribbella sp. NPDC026596]|uniref:hypothetical protein n=1 Tax=Kribbella sp. NPDC026596 TaxID=3155122 RepID=UPI003402C4DF
MLVTGSGQTPEVIDTDPGVRRIRSGSRSHSAWVRVIARSCSEFVRARWPSWLEIPGSRPLCCMCSKSLAEPYAWAATITCSAVYL